MTETTKQHDESWVESAGDSAVRENARLMARIRPLFRVSRWRHVARHGRGMMLMIFLVALSLRAGFALTLPEKIIWEDGYRYQKVAMNLLTTGEFGPLQDNRLSVPVQPLLMAAVGKVFGNNLLALRLVWALLGALTCVLAYPLGRALANPFVGLLAGLALAVYPYYVYLNTMFEYPQTVFIFLMALCFLGLIAFDAWHRMRTLFGASLCLGMAILSVPTVILFLPFILLWLASRLYPRPLLASAITALLLGALAPMTTWAYRNYVAYDHFVLINCAGGLSFWKGNNETYAAYGKLGTELEAGETPDPKYSFLTRFYQVKQAVETLGPVDSWIELERIGWRRGLEFVAQDPTRFLNLTFRKMLHLLSPYPDAVSNNGQRSPLRDVIALISYGPILLLGILGMLVGLRDWRRFAPVYVYLGASIIPYALFLPTTRYRLPIDFFLVMFAAIFVDALLRLWQNHVATEAASVAVPVRVHEPTLST